MAIPDQYGRSVDLRSLQYFVAVAEERNIGRAAARLHMTQPPLSRTMRQLEDDLGVLLLERIHGGVTLTSAGECVYADAVDLLARAARLRARVQREAGASALAVGSLADTLDLVGGRLLAAFRERHPAVSVTISEFDLGDPTAGLRDGRCDVALTRTPYDETGLRRHVLVRQQVGLVVRDDDPVAAAGPVAVDALTGRPWVALPQTADPAWLAYWAGPAPASGPTLRTIQECLQSVLWNGLTALAPIDQLLPAGLTIVPVTDRDPNELVLAWRANDTRPLIRSFVQVAAALFQDALPG